MSKGNRHRQPHAEEPEEDEPVPEETAEEKTDSETPKISKKLLIIGFLLLCAGFIGVIGLRLGFIQNLFGDPDPYPGIGSVEPSGHIVSMVPFVLGLVAVLAWGIRNDPIYYEMEKAEADEPDEEPEEEEMPEEPQLPKETDLPEEPAVTRETTVPKPEPVPSGKQKSKPEPGERIPEPEEPKGLTKESMPEDLREELLDSINDIEQELSEMQKTAVSKPKPQIQKAKTPTVLDGQAEMKRVERCNKMLSFADMSKEDKDRLSALIDTGISVHDFTQEVKEAVQRQKDRKAADAKTADQKATYLEDDLVAELIDLGNELEGDIDDADLEDIDLGHADKKKAVK